jgi:secreted PhoX family phosphatase
MLNLKNNNTLEFTMKKSIISLAISLAMSGAAIAADDFGLKVQNHLKENAKDYFGFIKPIGASESVSVPRMPGQSALDLIKLAPGLKASIVTRKAANTSDMLAFWPNDTNPTHLVTCIEDFRDPTDNVVGTLPSGQDKYGPSIQRVNLKTGAVETILRGMSSCDGIRRTPWNTIVATEERDDGGIYEILNPLAITEYTLVARGASDTVDSNGNAAAPGQVEYRGALGKLAWEGLDVTPQGVVYYGDEERPGSGGPDFDGGGMFKFVPELPSNGAPITDLSQSPLVAGSVYAFQASCQARTSSSFPQFGQGCEIGEGAWVKVDPDNLRLSAFMSSATGYYRPEDGHFDPMYTGAGVKFCWTNTGNSGAKNYGEVVCLIDTNPVGAGEKTVDATGLTYLADSAEVKGFAVAAANRAVEGDADLNQPDNLAFQPVTGNMYVIEDQTFGDVWACLPDGKDRDIKTDGCVKMLSVRDSSAEPTGFAFTGDGKTAYFHVQHSNDAACVDGTDCAKNDGYATDDLIKITGFKIKK